MKSIRMKKVHKIWKSIKKIKKYMNENVYKWKKVYESKMYELKVCKWKKSK